MKTLLERMGSERYEKELGKFMINNSIVSLEGVSDLLEGQSPSEIIYATRGIDFISKDWYQWDTNLNKVTSSFDEHELARFFEQWFEEDRKKGARFTISAFEGAERAARNVMWHLENYCSPEAYEEFKNEFFASGEFKHHWINKSDLAETMVDWCNNHERISKEIYVDLDELY